MTDLTCKKPWKGERKDSGIFKKRHPHFHIVEIIMDFVDWLPPSGPMCFQKGQLVEANVTPSSDAQVIGGESQEPMTRSPLLSAWAVVYPVSVLFEAVRSAATTMQHGLTNEALQDREWLQWSRHFTLLVLRSLLSTSLLR